MRRKHFRAKNEGEESRPKKDIRVKKGHLAHPQKNTRVFWLKMTKHEIGHSCDSVSKTEAPDKKDKEKRRTTLIDFEIVFG